MNTRVEIFTIIAASTITGLLTWFFLSHAKLPKRECVVWHEEQYYSTQGTALWVATQNPGFLAHNGWKTREICDKWIERSGK